MHQVGGPALGGGLQDLAEGHQQREHGRRVEVDVPHAADNARRAGEEGRQRPDGDERVEAQSAANDLARRADDERVDEDGHRRR